MSIAVGTLLIAGLSALAGGGGGYIFGTSVKEERFNSLQSEISRLTNIIAEQSITIEKLILELEEIRKTRNLFQRFLWFVFKSDPKLLDAFARLEKAQREKQQASREIKSVFETLRSEFPRNVLMAKT